MTISVFSVYRATLTLSVLIHLASGVSVVARAKQRTKFVLFDWIQVADHPGNFISVDNPQNPKSIVVGEKKFPFTFVEDTKNGYGLIMTKSRKYCLEVVDETDPGIPAARLIRVTKAPKRIRRGRPLPKGVTDGMIFSFNYKTKGAFQIKSKKYSDAEHPKEIVFDLKGGKLSRGTPILAHPDYGDNRYNQRWLFGRSGDREEKAKIVELGWIQLKDHANRFINFDSTSDDNATRVVIGIEKETFNFVYQPATYGQYGLLTSHDKKYVIRVSSDVDSIWPAARLVDVVPAPTIIKHGKALPLNIDDSLLFSINTKNGTFQIKNKKYSDQEAPKEFVLDLYTGNVNPGNKIVAHPDFSNDVYNQRWIFETRFGLKVHGDYTYNSHNGLSIPQDNHCSKEKMNIIQLGHIQLKDHVNHFLNFDSNSNPTKLIIGKEKHVFNFVSQPATYGQYGLLTSHDNKHVVRVSSDVDNVWPAVRLTEVVSAPMTIKSGELLPLNIDESMLFSINNQSGTFQIKNKKYSDLETPKEYVIDLYTGKITPGNKIVAHPDYGDHRYNQRWIIKSQFTDEIKVQQGTNCSDSKENAKIIELGWMQLKDHANRFVNFDSIDNPTKIVIGEEKVVFNFVIQPATYEQYGLLASHDNKHVVRVTNDIDEVWPAVRLTDVVPAPTTIKDGEPLPSNIDESLLFSINYKDGTFQIKNKKYSDLGAPKEVVLDLYTGKITPGNKIVAHPDYGDHRYNQRWILETQFKLKNSRDDSIVNIDSVSQQGNYFIPDASVNIIDGKWVCVDRGNKYGVLIAGAKDPTNLTETCYEFTMNQMNKNLKFKRDRLELSTAFVRFSDMPISLPEAEALQETKYVYSKAPINLAYVAQGSHVKYSFRMYLPANWTDNTGEANLNFAQWYGIPNSHLFKIHDGSNYRVEGPLSSIEALSVWSRYDFKNGVSSSPSSKVSYVEQGGRPVLAMKLKKNKLQVVSTGDAYWFSNKYKEGTSSNKWKPSAYDSLYEHKMLYSESLDVIPINTWVTFTVDVKWTDFVPSANKVKSYGNLKITMFDGENVISLVNVQNLLIGRNDPLGYYFNFGCYRFSEERVHLYMKDVEQVITQV